MHRFATPRSARIDIGLPLAMGFGKQYDIVECDIHTSRLEDLRAPSDRSPKIDADHSQCRYIWFSSVPDATSD